MLKSACLMRRVAGRLLAAGLAAFVAGNAQAACVAERPDAMAATDQTLCRSLADVIRSKEAANREKDRAVLPALKRLQMRLAGEREA